MNITTELRILANGMLPDAMDDYFDVSKTTALDYLTRFCAPLIDTLGEEYLRNPKVDDIYLIMEENDKRGLPGLLGSISASIWSRKAVLLVGMAN